MTHEARCCCHRYHLIHGETFNQLAMIFKVDPKSARFVKQYRLSHKHCKLYSVQCTPPAHCTLHTAHCTLHTAHNRLAQLSSLINPQCLAPNIQPSSLDIQCSTPTIQQDTEPNTQLSALFVKHSTLKFNTQNSTILPETPTTM